MDESLHRDPVASVVGKPTGGRHRAETLLKPAEDSSAAPPPASHGQRRFAAAAVVVSIAAFAVAAPFARLKLEPIPAFISTYESALAANALITAALLFGEFGFFRWRRLLWLAGGYLFTGLIAISHALTFPGLYAPAGVLGGGPQTTAWLYMFWHAGFPLFVIAYASDKGEQVPRGALGAVLRQIAWIVFAVAGLTALATAGHALLPRIMSGNGYSPSMIAIVGSVWLSSVAAFALLWRRKPHSVIDLWLLVVVWVGVLDVALSAVLNGGRFDLGFYAGRMYGFVAASVVLVALLVENAKLYYRLGERTRELERAKEAALDAKAAKAAFIAAMSHEIRTPLNGVMGMLELLSLTPLDGEQRTTLRIVHDSGRQLQRIVDDILDFSKLAAGRVELRPEPDSIADLVERVANTYSGNASSKGLALHTKIDERIAPVLCFDAVRVQQILNNLVANAIKFTAEGEVMITAQLVEATEAAQVVQLTVADTGTGISPEDGERLFTPFTQAGDHARGGTGLGLVISRRLAEAMGGDLALKSELGVGSRLILTLPLDIASAAPRREGGAGPRMKTIATPPPPSFDEARRAAILVMVVDDHPINRMLLAKQFTTLGYAVRAVEDGAEALEVYDAGGVGVIFTDCNMPVMDGYRMSEAIRERESASGAARVPIIACTANAMRGDAARCFAAGMDDYLAKPITLEQLEAKVEQWLPGGRSDPVPATPIDRKVLGEYSGGDAAAEREILAQFRSHHRADEEALRKALAGRDPQSIVQAAHRMRGAAASIGARGLAAACASIERAARANDWNLIEAGIGEVDTECRRLLDHIEAVKL
jgi:two-component system sensor histidine kinase/response regulator